MKSNRIEVRIPVISTTYSLRGWDALVTRLATIGVSIARINFDSLDILVARDRVSDVRNAF